MTDPYEQFQQWKQQQTAGDPYAQFQQWKQSRTAPAQQTPQGDLTEAASRQVTEEMGTGERLLVGAGRGLTSAYRGLKQLGLQAAGALGADTSQSLAELAAQESDEKKRFESGVGETTAGTIGAIAGETLPYLAIPGSGIARGATGINAALTRGAVAAGQGGIAGGLQYTEEGGDSRLENALQGALLGGAAYGTLAGAARAGSKAVNAVSRNLRGDAQEVLDLGVQHGVPVYAPDAAKSPLMSKAAVIAEEVPVVGMVKPRMRQAEAAQASAERLTQRLAPEVDDVGREIQESLTRRSAALQKAAGVRYDRVAQAADPLGKFPLMNMNATAKQLLNKAKQDIDPSNKLINRLERISRATKAPNFSSARFFRSNLNDEIRKLKKAGKLKAAKPLEDISRALDDDMSQFANNAGGDVAAKWRSADKFFRERVIPQRDSDFIKSMKSGTPDEIFQKFIKYNKTDRAQKLYNALDTKGRGAIKAGLLTQALQKATNQGANGIAFSPAKFAGELEKLQGATGVFFRGVDKKEIDGFSKLMRHVQRAGQVAENPPTGNRMIFLTAMTALAQPTTAAGIVGTTVAKRLLFTTDAGKRLLLASSRLPPGHPKLERAMEILGQQLAVGAGAQAE